MTGKIMPLREPDTSTIQAAADAFLSSPRYANPNTRRGYTGVLDRLLAGLGASRPLAEVSGEELAGLLEQLWGRCAPATWNRNRGAVTAWLSWCAASRLPAPVLPASAERRREHLNATRAVPRPAIERALSRCGSRPDRQPADQRVLSGMRRMSSCCARRIFAHRSGQCPRRGLSPICTCVRHIHEAIAVALGRADERGSRRMAIAGQERRRRGARHYQIRFAGPIVAEGIGGPGTHERWPRGPGPGRAWCEQMR
jgi:hypothetical protein